MKERLPRTKIDLEMMNKKMKPDATKIVSGYYYLTASTNELPQTHLR